MTSTQWENVFHTQGPICLLVFSDLEDILSFSVDTFLTFHKDSQNHPVPFPTQPWLEKQEWQWQSMSFLSLFLFILSYLWVHPGLHNCVKNHMWRSDVSAEVLCSWPPFRDKVFNEQELSAWLDKRTRKIHGHSYVRLYGLLVHSAVPSVLHECYTFELRPSYLHSRYFASWTTSPTSSYSFGLPFLFLLMKWEQGSSKLELWD